MIHHASDWCGPTASTLVLRALQCFPERTAFAWDGGSLSYGAALDLIGRVQGVIKAAGREPQVVAFLSANRADAWCAEVAVQALGLAVTWLHPMGALPDQLEQLNDSGAAALIVDALAFDQRGAELAALAPQLRRVWTLGTAGTGTAGSGTTAFGVDLLAAAQSMGPTTARDLSTPSSVATMNYTGGTTGRSKAVLRQQHAHAAMWRAILEDFELPARPRYLAAAPISHVAGTKIAPVLLRGGTVHLLQRFDTGEFLSKVQTQSINMSLLVPTMIYSLLDDPSLASRDLSSLELLMYGASPMSPTRLVEAMERIGPVFSQLYGQTECYPISLLRKADHDAAQPQLFASCGAPVASAEVRLLDEAGQSVPQGEAGEICVRAPQMMNGYWQRDELTRETTAGGWLHTGDIARMDERGFLFIVDRKKDMIVSGGFNVYPREVEDVLTSDPSVASAAVIGVPDAKWGETVLAVVVARPGAVIDADALAQLVKQRKGVQHAPKRVEVVDALPLTALGKIDKQALRAPHWPSGGRQVA